MVIDFEYKWCLVSAVPVAERPILWVDIRVYYLHHVRVRFSFQESSVEGNIYT